MDVPLLETLPPITHRRARERYAAALLQGTADLRAANGHLDLPSTAILTAIELGHTKRRPMTEATIAKSTGLDHRSVRRRVQVLIIAGEVMMVRWRFWPIRRPVTVYILNPATANDPKRVRQVKDAVKDHTEDMRMALEAFERPDDPDDDLPLLPANGGFSPVDKVET